MHVEVGYSDNPDTTLAGKEAAKAAMQQCGRTAQCDFALVFSTSKHDAKVLQNAILSILGPSVRLFGGGAVGAITNNHFGYSGDQVGLAAFWMDGAPFEMISEGGLVKSEKDAGLRLGQKLTSHGIKKESALLLLYDAIDRTRTDLRLIMATPLLKGIEEGLGFLPNITGAGLQGDFSSTPTKQFFGREILEHHALALTMSDEVQIDTIIMHGCLPATDYYTVTKAQGQTILEINHQPALNFLADLLGPGIPQEEYAFFLIFGVNSGEKWGEFDELSYANRLCLGIDKQRKGIVMFEPDMVAGTQFQLMYRAIDLDYIAPQVETLFNNLNGRKPFFSFYINCAGRAAGFAGDDFEDAIAVQRAVNDRVPLLGIYSGVEIASIKGRPRGLDWTGVFSLFSIKQ